MHRQQMGDHLRSNHQCLNLFGIIRMLDMCVGLVRVRFMAGRGLQCGCCRPLHVREDGAYTRSCCSCPWRRCWRGLLRCWIQGHHLRHPKGSTRDCGSVCQQGCHTVHHGMHGMHSTLYTCPLHLSVVGPASPFPASCTQAGTMPF
jgi:hypothetical protein